MLNSTKVLQYVKTNLAFSFNKIELEDNEILEYIQEYTLHEFSYYAPEVRKMNLSLNVESNIVPGRSNEWYLNEPEGREILNVVELYMPRTVYDIHGHPPISALDLGGLKNWALDVETSMMVKQFSSWDHTHEFIHPNIIRISPSPFKMGIIDVTVEYERIQSSDFRGIPNDRSHFFLELCLADIMIVLGRIRRKYGGGNLRTPFGEIPLEADILDEGRDKKREIIEKLTAGFLPNVVVDFG